MGSLEAVFLLTARGQVGMHKVMAGLPSASCPTSVMAQKPGSCEKGLASMLHSYGKPARIKLPFLKQHFSTCGPRSACATISLLEMQVAMHVCLLVIVCLLC